MTVTLNQNMGSPDVLQLALIGLFYEFFTDFIVCEIGLSQLLAIAIQLFLEIRIGVKAHSIGFHDFHAEVDEQIKIFIHRFLFDDVAFQIVLGINIGKLLHCNFLVTDGHKHLLIEF